MRKILFLLITLIFLLTPHTVFAHTTETDGEISATIHFDPDDDPIVGQQTGFYFHFKDSTGKFNPADCECTFTVLQAGKEISSQPLFQYNTNPGLDNVTLLYTFPERNIYQVRLAGKPLPGAVFQSFNLTFDIRVDRTSKEQKANPQEDQATWFESVISQPVSILLSLVIFGIFVIIAIIQKQKDLPSRKASARQGGR